MIEEFVSFENEGEKIVGVLHIPKKTPAPGVIFCHGGFGNRIGDHRFLVNPARELCGKGFAVLRFDFRGCGESEGSSESVTLSREMGDLKKAIDWLQGRPEVLRDKVGVLGHSLGGAVAILTSASDERLKAVCVMSSPADFGEMMSEIRDTSKLQLLMNLFIHPELALETKVISQRRGKEIREEFGVESLEELIEKSVKEGYVEIFGERLPMDFLQEVMTSDILGGAAKIAPRPILIIQGTEDILVSPSQAEKLFRHAGEPKEIFLVEGGDHAFSRGDIRSRVFQRVIDWFIEKLK